MANYSAGTADVEIHPNSTNFVRDLRSDLDLVEANLGVEIKADTSGFVRELEDYLKLVSADLDVVIHPDLTGFSTDLETKLGLISAEFDVDINPDTTDFAAELALKLSVINQAFDVKVGVDQTSLDNLEALIRSKLATMDLHVDVKVGADTRVAADELALLRASYREMTMRVDADTSAAAAQIGALNRIPVTANVRGGGSSGGAGGLLGAPGLLNVGALGLASLPAAASAMTSIGVGIQQIAQGGLLLPGIFAAAGAGIGTLVVGLNGMKDAFGEGKKAQEAYQGLSDEGRRLVDVTKSHGNEWDRIEKRIGTITLDGLSQPMDTLLTNQLPALDRGMGGLATQFNAGFKTLLGELGNEQSTKALDKVFGNTTTAAGILNGSITPIVNSIRTLGGTGSTFLPQLAQGFTNATTRLDAFLTRSNQSGDLSRWMREGIEAGKDFLSIIGNLGSMLASVLRAGKGDGEGFLSTVDRLTDKWSTFLKSSEGQANLRTFFEQGSAQMDRWQPLLQSLGSLLKSLYEASQAWSAILLPFLSAAASLLGNHDGILRTVLISYLAYRTLSPIFTMLQSGWASATTAVGRYNAAQTAASGAGATAMRSSMSGLAAMLGTGGIFGLAIAGAAIGIGLLAQKHQDAANAAAEQRRKLIELRETLDDQTGAVTKETVTSTTKDLEERGFLERAQTLGVNPQQYVRAGLGLDPSSKDAINARLTQIILEQKPTDAYGKSVFESAASMDGLNETIVAQALQGIPEAVAAFDAGVNASRARGKNPADLRELKDALNDVGESAATLGGEMNGLGTNTGQAAEAARRINETLNGTYQLTAQGIKSFNDLGLAVTQVPNEKTVVVSSTTDEQQRKLEELGYSVTHMEDGTVKITLNDEGARASIAELVKPETKRVNVEYTGNFSQGDFARTENQFQPVTPRADGGPITGGIPGRDSVPILAMPGEHMLDVGDVGALGGQAGVYRFRAALKAGLVRPMKDGGAVGWDDGDEIKLQQAQNAADRAREDLAALDFKKNVTPGDRRAAELKVQEADYRAQQLANRKSGNTGAGGGELLPQAALPGKRSNADLDKEDADAAVDQANTKRNQVYAKEGATDDEKRAADRDYQRAQNSRAETYKSKSDGDDASISLPGIAAKGAGILAEGFLSALGLENSILSGNNVYTKSLNTAINFYANKGADGGASSAGYDYTPKNLPQDSDSGSSSSDSSSSGTGGKTRSAEEFDGAGGVEQWRSTFASVLRALAMPASWLELGLAQMKTESGGNPKAINLTDSNAAKGTPSKGLMQVIDPTFASNRSELYPNDVWDPGANIAASLRYTVGRYTSPVGVWGQGHGYKDGGWVQGIGGPRDDLNQIFASPDEFVVSAGPAAAWGPQLEAINAGLPMPLPTLPTGLTPRGPESGGTVNRDHGVHFHAPVSVMDMGELVREQDRWSSLQAQGVMAGLPG